MQTAFILMAQYERAVIPAETVCRDYFAPLTLPVFLRKIGDGSINLPLIRMEESQKGARGVHVSDLAAYIDRKRAAALKEAKSLQA